MVKNSDLLSEIVTAMKLGAEPGTPLHVRDIEAKFKAISSHTLRTIL